MFGGGSGGHHPQEYQQAAPPAAPQTSQYNQQASNPCEVDQKAFMKCLESNSNDIGAW